MAVSKDEKTGKWVSKFRYHDLSGKAIQKRKIGFATKREAQAWETDFLAQHEGKERLTFAQAYARYLTDCEKRLKPTTTAGKRKQYKHFEVFYDLPIAEITPAKIRAWQNSELLKTDSDGTLYYTKATRRNINVDLSGFFGWACKFCGLERNPVRLAGTLNATGAREKEGLAKGQIWQLADFERFIKEVGQEEYRLIFEILFFCGLRRGEVMGLRVGDVNLENGILDIRQNRTSAGIGTTKTKQSRRKVSIPEFLRGKIRKYIGRLYNPRPSTLLFQMSPARVDYHFTEIQKKIEMKPRIRLHDLRHSHASMLINLGFSPDVVADRLGHANAAMVMTIYGHMYPQKRVEVVDALNKIASGK